MNRQLATRGPGTGRTRGRSRRQGAVQESIPHLELSININVSELKAHQLCPSIEVLQSQYSLVACLDAQKAFDVVDHNLLRLKLDSIGIKGKLWLLIDNLHLDINEVVEWKRHFSDGYTMKQGIRQGGILSTYLYKVYINSLLLMLERSGLGVSIGGLYLGAPTCADDVFLLADDCFQSQAMCCIAWETNGSPPQIHSPT